VNARYNIKELNIIIKFYLIAIIIIYVPSIIFYILIDFKIIKTSNILYTVIELIVYVFSLVLFLILYKNDFMCLKYTPLRREKSKITDYIIVAILFFIFLILEIIYLPSTPRNIDVAKIDVVMSYIVSIFFSPVYEEVLFRGIIFERLMKKNSKIISILVTSIMFAILHYEPKKVIGAFIFSVLICIIYNNSKNIMLAIWGHMIMNSSIWILFFMEKIGILPTSYNYNLNKLELPISVIIVAHISFFFVLGAYIFLRKTHINNNYAGDKTI